MVRWYLLVWFRASSWPQTFVV